MPWKRRGTPIKLLGVRSGHDLDPQDEWKKVVDALLVVLRIWSATPLDIRSRISELDMMRPIWAGGLDSWRPEDFS